MKMFTLIVTAAIVFLSAGGEAALPDVGSCSFMEYYCSALHCTTDFAKKIQKDPKGNCSMMFREMITCVKRILQICTARAPSDSAINKVVSEKQMCSDGVLEIPILPRSSLCTSSFSSDANNCMKTYYQKYAADKSDSSLCTEQAKAKQCMKNLMAANCTFPPTFQSFQEMIDLSFNDYNPFCANNRDPGATGNDACRDVKDVNNKITKPTNASAGLESSVLQALLFPFLFALIFLKS